MHLKEKQRMEIRVRCSMGPDNSPVSASFYPINPLLSCPNMGVGLWYLSQRIMGRRASLSSVVLRTQRKDTMTGSRFPANHSEKNYWTEHVEHSDCSQMHQHSAQHGFKKAQEMPDHWSQTTSRASARLSHRQHNPWARLGEMPWQQKPSNVRDLKTKANDHLDACL